VEVLELTNDLEPTGRPRELVTQTAQITSIAWSRDGASLIYAAYSVPWGFYLWRLPADGSHPPQRLEIAGLGAAAPATTRARDRLAFAHVRSSISIHRLDAAPTSRAVVSSALWDLHPQFSPDGQTLAFSSSRSGESVEIWLASADGSNPHQLTHGPGVHQGSAAWSPDGRWIAFDSQGLDGKWSIWIIARESGVPRRLTAGDDNMPTWSRDGRWIYFSRADGASRDIWRAPASGGEAQRLTHGGSSFIAFESEDGRDLVYKPNDLESPLLAQPLAGGPARRLIECVHNINFAIGRAGLYYAECGGGQERAQLVRERASGADRVLGRVRDTTALGFDRLAVSPDGRAILVHRESLSSDLMLIENFR
jgi:Tol biopolymer transport system component